MPTLERIGEVLISNAGAGAENISPGGRTMARNLKEEGVLPRGMPAAASGVDPNFRPFLTSMQCSYFLISLLQNGIKLTTESPAGIKANVRRLLAQKQDEDFNPVLLRGMDQTGYRLVFTKLQYGLLLFHALIPESKRFGPLGWSTRYDFRSVSVAGCG